MTELDNAGVTTADPAAHSRLGRLLLSREALMLYLLVALLIFAALRVPRFVSPLTAGFLLLDVIPTLLLALPMTMVMITGDIDLSVASVVGLTSATMGVLVQSGMSLPLVLVVCLLVGLACGVFNGVMTAYVGLPALAVTIGTMALYRGLALVVIGDNAVARFPAEATQFATAKLGATGIPVVIIPVLVIIALFAVWLHVTPFGRGVFALGYSKEAARFVGVDVARSRLLLFVASGLIAALVGIFWTLRYSSARSDNATGLELVVIAAVVLGGVSVFGGKGSIAGSIAGVLIIGVVNYALRLNRVPEVILVTITGLLLILSVVAPSIGAAIGGWRHARRQSIATNTASNG